MGPVNETQPVSFAVFILSLGWVKSRRSAKRCRLGLAWRLRRVRKTIEVNSPSKCLRFLSAHRRGGNGNRIAQQYESVLKWCLMALHSVKSSCQIRSSPQRRKSFANSGYGVGGASALRSGILARQRRTHCRNDYGLQRWRDCRRHGDRHRRGQRHFENSDHRRYGRIRRAEPAPRPI